MGPKKIAAVTAIAAMSALLGALAGRSTTDVETPQSQPTWSRIQGKSGAVVVTSALLAGARPEFRCELGASSNHPGRIYCTDGGTAGWLLDESIDLHGATVIVISDGKAYGR